MNKQVKRTVDCNNEADVLRERIRTNSKAYAGQLAAFILTSLLEGPTPNGHLYVHAMAEVPIDQWQSVVSSLIRQRQINESHHLLNLTTEGRELALRLQDAINQAEARQAAKPTVDITVIET